METFEVLETRYLLQKEYLGEEKQVNRITPVVSVTVATYQHSTYIRDCLDGILMQETTFPFEIIVGEDESSDGTREICIEYAKKHPDKIRLFLRDRKLSQYYENGKFVTRFNGIWNRMSARGKYIAWCEGDDYWTDIYKLQKQVDFLEENKNISFCFHNAKIFYCDSGYSVPFNVKLESQRYTTKDILIKGWIVPTASIVMRKECLPSPLPSWFYNVSSGDYALELLLTTNGDSYYMNETMSIYRKNALNSLSLQGNKPLEHLFNLYYLQREFLKIHYKKDPLIMHYILLRTKYNIMKVWIYNHFQFVEYLKNKIFYSQKFM